MSRTEEEYRYGWILQEKNDPLYHSYLLGEREKLQKILEKLQAIHIARRSGERILELQKSLDLLDVTLSRFS